MRQAIIKFEENMSKGSHPDNKKICLYIEIPAQTLRFYNLKSKHTKADFCACQHRKFKKLLSMVEQWEEAGIEAHLHKRFGNLKEYEAWKMTDYYPDDAVHWRVLILQDDGSWDLYLEQSLAFPPALEKIYRLAASMRKP